MFHTGYIRARLHGHGHGVRHGHGHGYGDTAKSKNIGHGHGVDTGIKYLFYILNYLTFSLLHTLQKIKYLTHLQ